MNRDALIILLFLGLWIVLNKWVLPWLGIPTCMSGGCCGTPSCTIEPTAQEKQPSDMSDQKTSQSPQQDGPLVSP
ncbi:hypothetical protein [Thermogutta sp.]|uniref:hypothetical protein n=1 Tax=Thermogutta sp. TaxID=1962930 RepID=UPI00321F7717